MDTLLVIVGIAGGAVGIAGFVAFLLVYGRGSVARETIALHEKNQKALEDRVKLLEESDAAKSKQIGELNGQIHTLKTLPLEKLANSYATMASTLEAMGATQSKLLELLANQPTPQPPQVTVNNTK